jgi:hypothetical protein
MNTTAMPARAQAPAPMSVYERYLTVWVFLCIVVGIVLGQLLPGVFQAVGRMEVAGCRPHSGRLASRIAPNQCSLAGESDDGLPGERVGALGCPRRE